VLNFRKPLDVLSDHCILPSMVSLPPHIFGCVTYVHLHPHQRTKLEERALKCVFVGYGSTQKGYCAYHPPSKKFGLNMFLVPQVSAKFGISPSSKLLTNLVLHLSKCVNLVLLTKF